MHQIDFLVKCWCITRIHTMVLFLKSSFLSLRS